MRRRALCRHPSAKVRPMLTVKAAKLKAPWSERNGRFSPLKAVVFAGLFVPAAWIVFQAAAGGLEPKPVTEMIHRSGDWALRFLLLSLFVTPLRKFAQWPKLIAI